MNNTTSTALLGTLLAIVLACGLAAPGLAGPDDHGLHENEDHEDRALISQQAATAAGLQTADVAPAEIRETLTLYGHVRLHEERVYRPAARFPGIVWEVRVQVGDEVTRGDTLAIVESNESLQHYEVVAPASGIVLERYVNPGDAADGALFQLADLDELWVEFMAFPRQLTRLAVGQTVYIRDIQGEAIHEAAISYLAPVGSQDTQGILVRALLENRDTDLAPGLLVTGEVVVSQREVPIAVRREAIQTFEGRPVVFVRHDGAFEARPLVLGARDLEHVEVLEGLEPGAEYVVANSYLVKADLLKSSAAHDH
jgi:cobalt-zinc-cadmium efflux system membrane fusion protein